MNGCSFRLPLFAAAFLGAMLIPPASAGGPGNSRWGDLGAEVQLGSFGLNFQKRLFQPGLEEEMCGRCRQYLEFGFEWDEFDVDGGVDRDGDSDDVDSTAFTVGYRYYVMTGDGKGRTREGLAAYLAAGLGRYDLDPGKAEPGFYAKAALEYPLTQSGRKNRVDPDDPDEPVLRKAFWSIIASVRYDEVDLARSSLDDTSVRVGIRLVVPSKRDRQRAICQRERDPLISAAKTADDLERVLREKRPKQCFDPKDQALHDELSEPTKKGQGGGTVGDSR